MKREAMTEEDLAALVDAEIQDAIAFDETELSADRTKALEYERGVMTDTPAAEGRSQVVSFDVRDTIEWIMPGLLRVFLATDRVGVYQPARPGDEQAAKQATDYVNYILLREEDGFNVLHDAIRDSLQTRNGYIKHWWDPTEEHETETMTGLSEDQLAQVHADDELTIIEHTEYPDESAQALAAQMPPEMLAQMPPIPSLHDVKVKRVSRSGRLRVMVVPPEELLINDGATDWNNVRFVAHRPSNKTRSDLIEEGYDKDLVDDIPSHSEADWSDERRARLERGYTMGRGGSGADRSMEQVEVFECHIKCDYNGDGIAEWRRIVTAGPAGGRALLANEEWEDELPYSDLRTGRVPHRWAGRSIHDLLWDIQRIKTVLWRQSLDNLYLQNYPQRAANLSQINNPDELMNPTLGGVIDTKSDPGTIIVPQVTPFVAKESFGVLEVLDGVVERRTGVSRQTMQLDPEALQNQSATAAMIAQSAAYSRIEMTARLLAEGGMKRLFQCLLKLVVKHQDRPRTIRLRDKFIEMDPRSWNANMDCTVNTGLGTGSRDRDMVMLNQVLGIQKEIIAKYGFGTPLVTPRHLYNTLSQLTESAGLKDVDMFFGEVTEEVAQQMAQQSGQNPEAEAKMAEAKAKVEASAAEAQAKMQLEQAKAQGALELERQKAAAQLEQQARQGEMDAALKREQMAAEMALKREQIAAELSLKREQLTAELELKRELGHLAARQQAQAGGTSGVHVGGEPG